MDGVDEDQGAGLMGQGGDFVDGIDRPQGVGGVADGHKAGLFL